MATPALQLALVEGAADWAVKRHAAYSRRDGSIDEAEVARWELVGMEGPVLQRADLAPVLLAPLAPLDAGRRALFFSHVDWNPLKHHCVVVIGADGAVERVLSGSAFKASGDYVSFPGVADELRRPRTPTGET